MKEKLLIGVITARASGAEQLQMLGGILSQTQKLGMNTVVFSNIYNFMEYRAGTGVENKIYELICSERLDGLILTAESVLNPDLQQFIYKYIIKSGLPIVVTGAVLKGLVCVNNDVESDFEEITSHLTDVHGFTDIDFLTGYDYMPTSHERADGYRKALESRGIPYDENKVIYGDFWNTSGEKLAHEYISGKRKFPQAVICANDYMAYGLCDALLDAGIRVPEDISVTGYEYVGKRFLHSPILTTYLRNRSAVGRKAVNTLYTMITGIKTDDISVNGYIIKGDSCPCGTELKFLSEELKNMRIEAKCLEMNLSGNFEQQLMLCRSVHEYVGVIREFSFLTVNISVEGMCLYENWYDYKRKTSLDCYSGNDSMIYYSIMDKNGKDRERIRRSQLFPDFFKNDGSIFLCPIFSSGRECGHFILKYKDGKDSECHSFYDKVFRNWLKSASNALEILRLKNDIHSLIEYKNLSEIRDTATGFLNKNGLIAEYNNIKIRANSKNIAFIMIKTNILDDNVSIDKKGELLKANMEIAESLSSIKAGDFELKSRYSDDIYIFMAFGNFENGYDKVIKDRIDTLILHSPIYSKNFGKSSKISVSSLENADTFSLEKQIQKGLAEIGKKIKLIAERRRNNSYNEFSQIRNMIYSSPTQDWNIEQISRDFHFSSGYFRALYKEIFGISFHQDLIQSRISLAKYLLLSSAMNVNAVAGKCGYEDDKYFMRQFRQSTGVTPNKYRGV